MIFNSLMDETAELLFLQDNPDAEIIKPEKKDSKGKDKKDKDSKDDKEKDRKDKIGKVEMKEIRKDKEEDKAN